MFKKKKNYLKQMYKTNQETNAFIVEILLDDYNEIFNGWDPSPIKRRDLDPDMVNFMETCSSDIPFKHSLELQFYMPGNQYNKEKEQLSITGIKNNFNFTLHSIKKELEQIGEKIALYIIMSIAFFSVGYLSRHKTSPNFFTAILIEGLSIGGWVFLWEAFSLFFFSRQEVSGRLKMYRRFQDTLISFQYK